MRGRKDVQVVFLKLLEKVGRSEALVDPHGEVMALRYFLLRKEGGQKNFIADWLPNIWLHKMLLDYGPDNGFIHRHPWATASIILSGGYTERLEGNEKRELRPGSVSLRPATRGHCIEKIIPNTWSLFAHWFKRQDWQFLEHDGSVVGFETHIQKFGAKNVHKWVVFNDAGKRRIGRRQKALHRLKSKLARSD